VSTRLGARYCSGHAYLAEPAPLSDGARLVLLELAAPPGTPISSAALAELLGTFSPAQVGAWLRELRVAGRAVALDAQSLDRLDRVPPGVRAVWIAA